VSSEPFVAGACCKDSGNVSSLSRALPAFVHIFLERSVVRSWVSVLGSCVVDRLLLLLLLLSLVNVTRDEVWLGD
jgi:hypothetical protein